jgi:hypothetical protein
MMEVYLRDLTSDEIEDLKLSISNIRKLMYGIIFKWGFISIITLIPLFFFKEIANSIIFSYIALDQLLVIALNIYSSKLIDKIAQKKKIEEAINHGKAAVTSIKTNKVIECQLRDNLSKGYFFDIGNGKTIFFENYHLAMLEFLGKFPNSDFEIVRTEVNNLYIAVLTKGKPINPIKVVRHLSINQYRIDKNYKDWQIIDRSIESII